MLRSGFLFTLIFSFNFLLSAKAPDNLSAFVEIHWTKPIQIRGSDGAERQILNFEGAKTGSGLFPEMLILIKGDVKSIRLDNTKSVVLSPEEAKLLPKGFSEKSYKTSISYGYENGVKYSFIYVLPLRISAEGKAEKLSSFNYSCQLGVSPRQYKITAVVARANQSVLASGTWYKLSVEASGMYVIDYNLLKSMGLNPENIDPRSIRLYGNGGGMLPQKNEADRYDDLVENPIFVSGEADGVFDPSDYVLFYALGPHTVSYNASLNQFEHTYNLYSNKAFYFLTVSNIAGKRVSSRASLASADQAVNTFDDFVFTENDQTNIIHSGRLWLGDKFDYISTSKVYTYNLPGLVPNSDFKITGSFAAASPVSTAFSVKVNGVNAGSAAISSIDFPDAEKPRAALTQKEFILNTNAFGASSQINLNLMYNTGGTSSSTGYLNFLALNYKRGLALYGNQTSFCSFASLATGSTEYQVGNVSGGTVIWDVTNPLSPVAQNYTLVGNTAHFNVESTTLHHFIVFSGNSFAKPAFVNQIQNQNLHAIGAPVPELLIITANQFVSEAQRLANYRSGMGISAKVVTVDQVYNEFSSGAQDITAIRDFVKMVYDRSAGGDSLKYLLLFGACSYDYKDRIPQNTNYVPTYEARESFNPVSTYSSDDFFGFMDAYEGDWLEPSPLKHLMDIGVGRLPFTNIADAGIMVNKIIDYETNQETRKKWRNEICVVADDGEANAFQNDAEKISSQISSTAPQFNISKLYLDAYPQTPSPGGELSLEAKKLLSQKAEQGMLILNYIGHGGTTGWSQEKVLEVSDILSWNNYEKLPFMVTATCDFGVYDDPAVVSAAVYALKSSTGGAIALMTTSRPVYISSNYQINAALYTCIFNKEKGNWLPLGTIMKRTKNETIGNNDPSISDAVYNRNYSLLGDPSLTLAYPKQEVVITSINGHDIATYTDTLKALSKATITGEIRSGGSINTAFNGLTDIKVFDKPSEITTLGNEGPGSPPITFSMFSNSLYSGKASVKEGKFSVTFIVPKDISYQYAKGKISIYSKQNNTLLDAGGYGKKFVVGGSAENVNQDNTPPQIKAFMNDASFVNGGLTDASPLLLLDLYDENGINITGTGIGHDITAVLDDSKNPIVLNDYYQGTLDNYQEGKVKFPLEDLAPGVHSVKIKAWDTYNNSSEVSLEFIVYNEEHITLRNVLNYPNPFSTHTTFHFDQNRAGDDIEVLIQIFTISGKLIKTLDRVFYLAGSHISGLDWNGKDDFGDTIGKGVYVYKLNVKSLRDGSTSHKFQKLVLLN